MRTPPFKSVAATLLACAFLLGGCGASPTAAKRSFDGSRATAPTGGGWVGTPGIGLAPAAVDPAALAKAKEMLVSVAQRQDGVRNWTATAQTDVLGPAPGERNWNKSKISYLRPSNTMAATVLSAKDNKADNTKIIYQGGSDVRVKTYFFGFIALKLSLPVDDSRMVDGYKRSLRDTQTKQLFEVLLDPQAQVAYAGEGMAAGEAVDFLDVRSTHSWKGITHEVMGISKRLGLPISRDCYDAKGTKIFALQLRGMKINFAAPSNEFTLD